MTTTIIESKPETLQKDAQRYFDEVGSDFDKIQRLQLWADVLMDLQELHLQYFQSEAGPDGPWDPLAPRTVQRKGHSGILWETTRLMASMVDSAAQDSIRETYDDGGNAGFSYGTSTEYAHFHQSGTSKMPARPFIGITDAVVDAITERILDNQVEGLKK